MADSQRVPAPDLEKLEQEMNALSDPFAPKVEEEVKVEPTVTKSESEGEKVVEPKAPAEDKIDLDLYKARKQRWHEQREKLEAQISELQNRIGSTASKPTDELNDQEIDSLVSTAQTDPKKFVKDIIALARKGVELPTEIKSKLDKLDQLPSNDDQEERGFENEWKDTESELKTDYPEATQTQLSAAKELMKELSYDDKFIEREMDYIYFKNSDEFDKILSSTAKKTFERSSYIRPEPTKDRPSFLDMDSIIGKSPKEIDRAYEEFQEKVRAADKTTLHRNGNEIQV